MAVHLSRIGIKRWRHNQLKNNVIITNSYSRKTIDRNGRFTEKLDSSKELTALEFADTDLYWPLRKYSANLAPLVPVEKFSIDRTGSIGTEVPPEVINTVPDISLVDQSNFIKDILLNYDILYTIT